MRDRNAPLTTATIGSLAWEKMDGLIPAVVQDARTAQVLMLGYVSSASLEATLRDGRVTFHSRSKGRLWQKGETSGHILEVRSVHTDCDGDAVLILADPHGPTCHVGTQSCFAQQDADSPAWLAELAAIVHARRKSAPAESYTARLLAEGPMRIAQKVGEEGVELALAGAAGTREACVSEAADLLYHMTVLMQARGFGWGDVVAALKVRHQPEAESNSSA